MSNDVLELRVATQPEWEGAVAFYRSAGFEPYDRDPVDVHLRRFLTEPGGVRPSDPRTDGSVGPILPKEAS